MQLALMTFLAAAAAATPTGGKVPADSFYSLKTTTLQGQPADLSQYAGKVALVVNVASECGYTPQYAGLEKLYEELQGRGFTVLGFPSNEFGKQEPGDAEQIATFCKRNYGVTFPMFSKLVTAKGEGQSPVYEFLGQASGQLPQWNFAKYLVGRDGKVLGFYSSKVTPESKELRDKIESALGN
jgi:glutathione peroxidase